MHVLARHALRSVLASAAVVLLLALAAGWVRLLPWMVSPEVPLPVALPFARALLAVAVETAVLVGVPVGLAFAAARCVERGEARALFALGASPGRLVANLTLTQGSIGLASLACLLATSSPAAHPGRFAHQLLEQGKHSCAAADQPRSAQVPLVGVSWLCFPGQPPRVVGPLPRSGERAWFTAEDLVPSDDLRTLQLSKLRLFVRSGEQAAPRVRLDVQRATIAGLPAWGPPAKLSPWSRALLVIAAAWAPGLVLCGGLLRHAGLRRGPATVAGACVAGAGLIALHRLDRSLPSLAAYWLLPLGLCLFTGGCVFLTLMTARLSILLPVWLRRRIARVQGR